MEVPLYNLQNVNAQSILWELPGSDIADSSEDAPVFSYPEAGTYTITQVVEYVGCVTDFSLDITVVAPATEGLITEQALCEPGDFLFDLSDLGAVDFLWKADSSTDASFLADRPGTYSVEVTDEYCTTELDLSLSYFDFESINVDLGEDTTICLQKPLLYDLSLDTQVVYSWNDGETTLDRSISEPGLYTLTTSIGECATSSSIQIEVEDCASQIYIPNSFPQTPYSG